MAKKKAVKLQTRSKAKATDAPMVPSAMEGDNPLALLVAGDVTVDWLLFEQRRQSRNIAKEVRYEREAEVAVMKGGAWFLATAIRHLLSCMLHENLYCYRAINSNLLRTQHSTLLLNTFAEFRSHTKSPLPNLMQYRMVPDSLRILAAKDAPKLQPWLVPSEVPLPQEVNYEKLEQAISQPTLFPQNAPRLVVLKHQHAKFLQTKSDGVHFDWEHLVPVHNPGSSVADFVTLIVLNTRNLRDLLKPVGSNSSRFFIDNVLKKAPYRDRTLIVCDADELRRVGIRLSRGTSWEQTAYDVVNQFQSNPILANVREVAHFVIRFGSSGLLYRRVNHGTKSYRLCFDPSSMEDDWPGRSDDEMFGKDSLVTAHLATHCYEELESKFKSTDLLNPNERAHIDQVVSDQIIQALPQALSALRASYTNGIWMTSRSISESISKWDAWDLPPPIKKTSLVGLTKALHDYRATTFVLGSTSFTEAQSGSELDPVSIKFSLELDETQHFYKYRPEDRAGILHRAVSRFKELVNSEFLSVASKLKCNVLIREDQSSLGVNSQFLEMRLSAFDREYIQNLKELVESRGYKLYPPTADCSTLRNAFCVHVVTVLRELNEVVAVKFAFQLNAPFSLCGYSDTSAFASVDVQDNPSWTILRAQSVSSSTVAKKIVKHGIERVLKSATDKSSDHPRFPVAHFGDLVTVDREEIESFRSIRLLVKNYIQSSSKRPLCIAVFGPPGSGKSFGVRQIAKTVGVTDEPLEYNLSQFTSPDSLSDALIKVRDKALSGSVPLVFFDEFDSQFSGMPLGWLKYFLSVMQDGSFRYKDSTLGCGRSVMVFAGGTSESFEAFVPKATDAFRETFKLAKGPDFVSRLRGVIDIFGINPPEKWDPKDRTFEIRRAVVLRSLFERFYKRLINPNDEVNIDDQVLTALLSVSRFRHGARSLEALLEMSSLSGTSYFAASNLPSPNQLRLHLAGEDMAIVQEFVNYLDGVSPSHVPG